MSVGQRFKQLLFFLDKTGSELAKDISVTETAISKTVRGASLPSSKLLIPLGEKLGVSADWLLFGVGEMYLVKKEDSPKAKKNTKEGLESSKIQALEMEIKYLKQRLEDKEQVIKSKNEIINFLKEE